MGLALKNINANRSSGRSATNFDSSSRATSPFCSPRDRPAARTHERIERAPVAGQHPVVHASAAIDEHEDLGAASGAHDLRLPPPGPANASTVLRMASTPRARHEKTGDPPHPIRRQPGQTRERQRVAAAAQQRQQGQRQQQQSPGLGKIEAAAHRSCRFSMRRSSEHSLRTDSGWPAAPRRRTARPTGRRTARSSRTQRCEVRGLPEQIGQRRGLHGVSGGPVERTVQRVPGFRCACPRGGESRAARAQKAESSWRASCATGTTPARRPA